MKTIHSFPSPLPESDAVGYFKTALVELRRHDVRRALCEMAWAVREVCWAITHQHG